MCCYSNVSIQLLQLCWIDKFDKISADLALKILVLAVHFVRIIVNFLSTYLYAPKIYFRSALHFRCSFYSVRLQSF